MNNKLDIIKSLLTSVTGGDDFSNDYWWMASNKAFDGRTPNDLLWANEEDKLIKYLSEMLKQND